MQCVVPRAGLVIDYGVITTTTRMNSLQFSHAMLLNDVTNDTLPPPFISDDFPVDQRKCRLLGPTALVSPRSIALMFLSTYWYLGGASIDGRVRNFVSCLQTSEGDKEAAMANLVGYSTNL